MTTCRRVPLLLVLFLVAWIPAGCGSGEGAGGGGAPSGPALIPVDSVRLARSDSVYIGKPGEPHVDPHDGSFYVPDLFSRSVYRFARDGRLLRIYGRAGQGPGEFRWPGAVFVPDDSTVVVVDTHNQRLSFFDRAAGFHRRDRPLPGMPSLAAPLVRADTMWLSMMRFGVRKSLVRLPVRSDSYEWIGRLPGPIQTSLDGPARFARFFTWLGYLSGHEGRILHGFKVLNWIYARGPSGTVLDSVYVPEARRRGVPSDLREKVDGRRIGNLDALEATSALFGLYEMPDGNVALEHQDWSLLSREVIPPPNTATVWISLLSEDMEHACVDARLSGSSDVKPTVSFRGDTVFHLERRIVTENGDVTTTPGSERPGLEAWMRIVRVDPEGCDWIPARPPTDRR